MTAAYKRSEQNEKLWVIDEEAAEVVRRIYKLCIEGKGAETTARILHESGILKPTAYWKAKGIRKPGKKSAKKDPCHWCKTTVNKMLAAREYMGDVVNFKTYSKSYKLKKRLNNPKTNWTIHKDVHPAIVEREVFEQVQRTFGNTKMRKPKDIPKHMLASYLECSNCG